MYDHYADERTAAAATQVPEIQFIMRNIRDRRIQFERTLSLSLRISSGDAFLLLCRCNVFLYTKCIGDFIARER